MYYRVTIQPVWSDDTVSAMNITCKTDLHVRAGERLAAHILEIVKIPFCPMEGLTFSDAWGELPVTSEDADAEMGFVFRRFFLAERDTSGEVTIRYRILPRIQPEGYHSSPYFDLVAEKGGVNGSGTTFLVHPADLDARTDLRLTWDLGLLPDGCRGVWSLGAGDMAEKSDAAVREMLFSVYAAGKIRSVERGVAGFFWFDEIPLDADAAADTVCMMFLYLSEKFHDKGGDYRVFLRRNHFEGRGGTAFPRAYIMGYGQNDPMELQSLFSLLAHEMVHNWPTMRDNPPGLGTWYVEGSAEYYSVVTLSEMGLATPEQIASEINDKAAAYYENPYMETDNMSLGKLYWEDRAAQRLPYARGMIYLSNVDARVRRATAGKKSLIDIELALLELDDPTPEDFVRLGSEIAGFDLRPDFEAMCAGGMLIPDPDAFGDRIRSVPCKAQVNQAPHRGDLDLTGEIRDGYRWEARRDKNRPACD